MRMMIENHGCTATQFFRPGEPCRHCFDAVQVEEEFLQYVRPALFDRDGGRRDRTVVVGLTTDSGGTFDLKDYSGKNVVLYFFPKADTPG